MPNSYKDIIITPNRSSSTADPNISFRGANTASNTEIVARVYPESNGTLSFEGSAGQLLSITNDLTNTIFSVNDVSGIPSLEIFANGNVAIAHYGGNVGIGNASPTSTLHVFGNANVTAGINTSTLNAATVISTAGINVFSQAISAYTTANSAANTARVSANTGSTVSARSVRFNNTSSVLVAVAADPTDTTNVNVSFSVSGASAGSAYDQANGAYAQANAAYAKANTPAIFANGTIVVSNTGNVNFNNTASINVAASANGIQSNIAFSVNTTSITSVGTLSQLGVTNNINAATANITTRLDAKYGVIGAANSDSNLNIPTLDVNGSWLRIGDSITNFTSANGTGIKLADTGLAHWSFGMANTGQFVISQTSSNNNQLFPSTRIDAININTSGGVNVAVSMVAPLATITTANISTANVTTVVGTSTSLTLLTGTASNGNLIFGANGSEWMRLTNIGRLGIGTTTPNSTLVVAGNIWATTGINAATINVASGTTNTFSLVANNATITNVTPTRIANVYAAPGDFRQSLSIMPTAEELGSFDGMFTNKFRFVTPTAQEESTDGTTWTTSARATANQLADLMLGAGQTTSINIIPAGTIGVADYYRLTWNSASTTGYCFLHYLWMYMSGNGNSVSYIVEAYHNTTGWTTIATASGFNQWPGYATIKHAYIPYHPTTLTQYSQVRITFSSTRATVNPIELYSVEWSGSYPAGRRTAEYYDRNKHVYFPNAIYAGANSSNTVWHAGNYNAYGAANSAANTTRVSANGGSTVSGRSVRFNNTASILVSVAADPTDTSNINVEFSTSGASAGDAYNQANSAYAKANTPAVFANGTIVVSNTGNVNFNNTASVNVAASANGSQSNIAFTVNTSSITSLGTLTQLGVTNNINAATVNTTTMLANTSIIGRSYRFGATRTLPTVVNDAVEIGSVALNNGGGYIDISIVVPSSSFSASKKYLIPVNYNETSGVWQTVAPISSGGAYSGNDYDLEINVNAGTASFRIRRTVGTTAGTAYLAVEVSGWTTSFTESSATATVTAPTEYYNAAVLQQYDGVAYVKGNTIWHAGNYNAYGQANSAYGQANAAYGQANAAYTQANSAYGQANTATTNASNAYGQANAAYTQANTATTNAGNAYGQANAAYTQANSAYGQANTAYGQANSAYAGANTANTNALNAYAKANTAGTDAVNAYGQANAAYTRANTANGTVTVHANGTLVLANANLNFNNTASVNVSVTANGTGQANAGFVVNTSSITSVGTLTSLNLSGTMNSTANVVFTSNVVDLPILEVTADTTIADNAAGKIIIANSTSPITITLAAATQKGFGVTVYRKNTGNVRLVTSGVTKYNSSAYTTANIIEQNASATVIYSATNEILLFGDLENNLVPGANAANTTRVSANGGSTVSGRSVRFNNTASILVSVAADPTDTSNINVEFSTSGASAGDAYNQANTARNTANAAYGQANAAYTQANSAYGAANTAGTNALNAYGQANAAYGQANAAYAGANTANTNALNAYGQANAAYTRANAAYAHANTIYDQANAAYGQANSARGQANTAYGQANAAYGQANSAYTAANSAMNYRGSTGSTDYTDANTNYQAATSNGYYNVPGPTDSRTALVFNAGGSAGPVQLEFSYTGLVRFRNKTDSTTWTSFKTIWHSGNYDAYAQANGAYAQANIVYAQANSARSQANTAYDQANAAYGRANAAYAHANTIYDQANTARNTANAAYGQANAAYGQANGAYGQANGAYAQANTSANTVWVYANGTSVLSKANLNFNNTASVNVAASANGTGQANIAFVVNTSSITSVGTLTSLNLSGTMNSTANVVFTSNVVDMPILEVTADTTIADNAAGKIIVANSTSAITITLAAATQKGFGVTVYRKNTGNVRLVTSGVTKYNSSAYTTANIIEQNASATVVYSATNEVLLFGDLENNLVPGANAANTARVSANGGSTVSGRSIRFNNTASILVSVAADPTDTSNINVEFTTSGASAGAAYDQANTAYNKANTAYDQANSAYGRANAAYAHANTIYDQANTARNTANAAYGQANTAGTNALNAYGQANSAYAKANTPAVFANGTIVVSNTGNVNFNNTASVNVAASANGIQSNIAFTVNTSSITSLGTLTQLGVTNNVNAATVNAATVINTGSGINVFSQAVSAYTDANTANTNAKNAYGQANTATTNAGNAYGQANTATTNAGNAYGQANAAYGQANAAYGGANTANTNALNAYGAANTAGTNALNAYAAANTAANTTRVSANSASTVSGRSVNFINTASVTVSVVANPSDATNVNVSFTTSGASAGAAYDQANAAYGQANSAYGRANAAYAHANTIYDQANTARNTANGAYAQANGAYAQANGAYAHANIVYGQANAAYGQANAVYGVANTSANTVWVYANGTSVLSKSNLNFNNTASVNVSVTANGSTQSNISFVMNTSSITSHGTLTSLNVSGTTNVTGNVVFTSNVVDLPIVSITSNPAVHYSDNAAGKTLVCTTTAPTGVTLTFGAAAQAGFAVTVLRMGTGNVTIANTTAVTRRNVSTFTTLNLSSQYSGATVLYTATNEFVLFGDIL